MMILLYTVHIVVSVILILVVLLQTGKRADLAGAFGGGGSQTAFGTRGAATLLSKTTTIAAIVFMLTSLSLSLLSTSGEHRSGSVLDESPAPAAPVQPAPK
jgi:preprotein translocase subunit SecG